MIGERTIMRKEVDSAVQFICSLLRARRLSLDVVETFRAVLCNVIYGRYEGHWFPEKPCKGSAYRCMRINNCNIDPLIVSAGLGSGLTIAQLLDLLPSQLTIWVDPCEVAYRIGEDGSIGVLYDGSVANSDSEQSGNADSDASLISGSDSLKSSPSQSPVPSSSESESTPPPSPRASYSALTCRHEGESAVVGEVAAAETGSSVEFRNNSASILIA